MVLRTTLKLFWASLLVGFGSKRSSSFGHRGEITVQTSGRRVELLHTARFAVETAACCHLITHSTNDVVLKGAHKNVPSYQFIHPEAARPTLSGPPSSFYQLMDDKSFPSGEFSASLGIDLK